jgi:DNA-binding CsgD family transcriptional regulator
VQWLDRSSAGVLEFVLRRLERAPVGLLATWRSEGEQALPLGLARPVGELRCHRVAVGPLERAALGELVGARLGARLPRAELARLHELSGGNPFFALELARAARRRGAALGPGRPVQLPGTLQELLADRLARLPPGTRELLLAAAALSQPTRSVVSAALGPGTAAALVDAVDADVLEVDGDRLRLSHPLLAAAVYGGATKAARRRLHRRLAEVTSDPEERARQLAAASLPPDGQVAAALETAAGLARSRGAPEAAAELADLACRFTPSEEATGLRRRSIDAAYHHLAAGELGRGRELFERALAASPPGPPRAEVLWRMAMALRIANQLPAAVGLLREALEESRGDAALTARVHEKLSMCLFLLGELAAAEEHARQAVEQAEALGDDGLLYGALNAAAIVGFFRGRGPPAEATLQRVLALEDRIGPLPPNESARNGIAIQQIARDELAAARPTVEAMRARAERLGEEVSLAWSLGALAELEWRAGDWARADGYATLAFKAAERTGEPGAAASALPVMALLDASLGRVEAAHARATQAAHLAEQTGALPILVQSSGVLGFLAVSLGQPEQAHGYLGPVLERVTAMGLREPGLTRLLWDDIEACIAADRLDQAEVLLGELDAQGRALDRPWALATAARGRGLLAAARGDLPGALDALEGSLAQHQRLGQPFELGRTLLALGVVRRRAKQKRTARQALEAFERLGAILWAATTRGELGRIGGRAPGPGGLTPTERRVAELVAQGHTNREVADRLFLSPKTVAANLTSVYAKLGVRSRTELARHLARGDAAPS